MHIVIVLSVTNKHFMLNVVMLSVVITECHGTLGNANEQEKAFFYKLEGSGG